MKLPARSVGARELKPKAVTRAAIKANAVDGSKVAANALTGSDIKESSLGQVPSAAAAASAASSTHAGAAAALDRVDLSRGDRQRRGRPEGRDGTARHRELRHRPGGDRRRRQGRRPEKTAIVDSYPDAGGRAWTAQVDNSDTTSPHGFSVFAICVAAASVG